MVNVIMDKYISGKKAKEILGVHTQTLYNWEKIGKLETIRTAGGQRKYNVDKYLEKYGQGDDTDIESVHETIDNTKLNICYIRVSTLNQRDDLIRQK